jgi:hypothetical protein
MKHEELIKQLTDVSQDLEKAQMRGIQATHKQILVFAASRTIKNILNDLTNEGEANESN